MGAEEAEAEAELEASGKRTSQGLGERREGRAGREGNSRGCGGKITRLRNDLQGKGVGCLSFAPGNLGDG